MDVFALESIGVGSKAWWKSGLCSEGFSARVASTKMVRTGVFNFQQVPHHTKHSESLHGCRGTPEGTWAFGIWLEAGFRDVLEYRELREF
jgi:hypothetical protein